MVISELVRIENSYMCIGITIIDGIVVDAPPIAKWTLGKRYDAVKNYYETKKHSTVQTLGVTLNENKTNNRKPTGNK